MTLRDQYLGWFANICHMNPTEVDVLRMSDWAKLVLFIEAYLKSKKQQGE